MVALEKIEDILSDNNQIFFLVYIHEPQTKQTLMDAMGKMENLLSGRNLTFLVYIHEL